MFAGELRGFRLDVSGSPGGCISRGRQGGGGEKKTLGGRLVGEKYKNSLKDSRDLKKERPVLSPLVNGASSSNKEGAQESTSKDWLEHKGKDHASNSNAFLATLNLMDVPPETTSKKVADSEIAATVEETPTIQGMVEFGSEGERYSSDEGGFSVSTAIVGGSANESPPSPANSVGSNGTEVDYQETPASPTIKELIEQTSPTYSPEILKSPALAKVYKENGKNLIFLESLSRPGEGIYGEIIRELGVGANKRVSMALFFLEGNKIARKVLVQAKRFDMRESYEEAPFNYEPIINSRRVRITRVGGSVDPKHLKQCFYDLWRLLKQVKNMHDQGIVNRDIKPENMLIYNGQLHVIDRDTECNEGNEAVVAGTEAYAAPEVLEIKYRCGVVEKSQDIFSIGVSLLELFTGYRLVDIISDMGVPRDKLCNDYVEVLKEVLSSNDQLNKLKTAINLQLKQTFHVSDHDDRIPSVNKLMEELGHVLMRCFSLDPSQRPSIDELIADIDDMIRSNGNLINSSMPKKLF